MGNKIKIRYILKQEHLDSVGLSLHVVREVLANISAETNMSRETGQSYIRCINNEVISIAKILNLTL